MIRVTCSNCGKTLAAKDELAGKKVKCPGCAQVMRIPEASRSTSDTDTELPSVDPLVAMASNAASSVASAAGSAANIVGNAVSGLFKRNPEKNAIITTEKQPASGDGGWRDVFTRDDQSPDVVRAVLDKVSGILMAGETVTYIAVQNKPILNFSPDCIALTNKRFIFYRPKLLGRVEFEDYVWRELRDAKLTENVIGSTIRAQTADGKELSLDYLPKAQARAIYRIAQEMEETTLQIRRDRMLEEKRAAAGSVNVQANVAVPHQAAPSVDNNDPMVKLQKLKTMADAGLITSDEYTAKKADILANM